MSNDWLRVEVPRTLRVRRAVQVGSIRMSAKSFYVCVGLLPLWILFVLSGMPFELASAVLGICFLVVLFFFEKDWAGRSTWVMIQIQLRYLRQPKQGRMEPIYITIASSNCVGLGMNLRPRWQTSTQPSQSYGQAQEERIHAAH